jgi:septum formation protein
MVGSVQRDIDLQLASTSPRRAELLEQIGVRFQTVSVDVDETRNDSESVHDYVVRLAESKAKQGYSNSPGLPTLGSDTVVCCQREVFGKPKNKNDAIRMLQMMSGSRHDVFTAVAVFDEKTLKSRMVGSEVSFRDLSIEECERYWLTGEPKDKAGAYGIQGKAAVFINHLSGSYSAVMGLPLSETSDLLSEFGVGVWQK